MFDNSLHSKCLFLAVLALFATNLAAAQAPTVPPLTVTQLTATIDDWGSFSPPLAFGAAVGISGTTAVVGIPLYALLDASNTNAIELGRVAVFTQGSDGTWERTGSLVPADRQPNEQAFGSAVAVANNILIVASGSAVRVFVNKNGTWTQTATLPETPGGFNGQSYPQIAFDGHYFAYVVGAPTSSDGSGSNPPAFLVHLYSVDSSGQPEFLGSLSPSHLYPGGIVLVSGILAVKGLDSSGNGLVYVYSANSATPTVPQVLSSSDPTPDSTFGNSIAIWNQTILVGAPGAYGQPNDNTGGYFSGAAYVFAPSATGWVHTQKIVPNDSAGFGTAVALTQAGALISAPYSDDRLATILGATQIYVWQGNQLVFAQSLSGHTGTSIALSGTEAIIGTQQMIAPYGSYEYADIFTIAPGGSKSP